MTPEQTKKRDEIQSEFDRRKAELEAERAARKKHLETREQRTQRLIDSIIAATDPIRFLARRAARRKQ